MATFFKRVNNGVVGICSGNTYYKIEERRKLLAECRRCGLPQPQLPPVAPIFTFSMPDHPSHRLFHTGSLVDMEELLRGHNVMNGSFWVPFSNGIENRYMSDPEEARWEWEFRTTLGEAIEAFGLKRF